MIKESACIVITGLKKKKKKEERASSRRIPSVPALLSLASLSPFHPLPQPRVLLLLLSLFCVPSPVDYYLLAYSCSTPYYSLLYTSLLSFHPLLYQHPLCSTRDTTISTMPYNTRRKSLSLPSLGIHLPNSSRRSPSISKASHATDDLPPSKKVKRSHDSLSPEPALKASAVRAARHGAWEHTPPPSPLDGGVAPKIDTEGINDDIVVAVIGQLEKTGNRPHLVKELAAVLVALNANVARCVGYSHHRGSPCR